LVSVIATTFDLSFFATFEVIEMASSQEPLLEPATEVRLATFASFHHEKHSDYGEVVRDVIIGFADGLTVPFALTAGLSS
jgi:hypothetical protein